MMRTIKITMVVFGCAWGGLGVGGCSPSSQPAAEPVTPPATQSSTQPAKDANALAHLVEFLQDPKASVRFRSVVALGELDDVRACLPLIRLASTETDPKVLRSVATALAVIGAARGRVELRDSLVERLMRPVPSDWRGQVEAGEAVFLPGEVTNMSTYVNLRSLPDNASSTPIRLDELAGRPAIGALAALVMAMDPNGDSAFLLTPSINIIPLSEAIAWHEMDRQLRIISESRRKLASATEKGRATLKRMQWRISGMPDYECLADLIAKAAEVTELQVKVDWDDLKKQGYKDDAGYGFALGGPKKHELWSALDYLEFWGEGANRGLSFLVEPDGSVTIATRDTIAKRLAARIDQNYTHHK